jgi:hypothetical protein
MKVPRNKHFKVLHLDDQADNVSWIPRAINNWFWKNFRREMATTPPMEENDEETTFKISLRVSDESIVIDYKIFEDPGEFIDAVKSIGSTPNLVILDQAIHNDFVAGGRVFQEIENLVEHIVVLTAYPHETCSYLNWAINDSRLIAKPPDVMDVIKHFVRALTRVLGASAETLLIERLKGEESG